MQKDKKFSLHITEEDWYKMKELRNKYDINMSYYFRDCMRKLYKKLTNNEKDS